MNKMKSEGVCRLCGKSFSGSSMTRHLQSCIQKNAPEPKKTSGNIFLIKASAGPFWVYFEVNDSSKLEEIDHFLRNLWLECCGHMSSFTIGSVDYLSDTQFMDPGEKNMNITLKKVLVPGLEFRHEYDFGSTTELDLKCISIRQGKLDEIKILARNNMPEILCDKCGKPAVSICTECVWEDEGFLCESCAEKHECDEEMFLPVVNSPRMGVCGYDGSDFDG
jgi:hypothetical protein